MLTDQASVLASTEQRREKGIRIGARALACLLVLLGSILALLLAGSESRRDASLIWWFSLLACVIAAAPILMTYPLIHLMASPLLSLAFAAMLGFAILAAALAARIAGFKGETRTRSLVG
jgi:hypothetical protein